MNINDNLKTVKLSNDEDKIFDIAYTASEILPGLWIGGYGVAKNADFIQQNGIHSVVNISNDYPDYFPNKIKYYNIKIGDSPKENIQQYFDGVSNFITHRLKTNGKGVLVHCQMGISRSTSLVIAFLINKFNLSANTAINIVKRGRVHTNPNPGFQKQLQIYAKK